jgi:hypothetical protein
MTAVSNSCIVRAIAVVNHLAQVERLTSPLSHLSDGGESALGQDLFGGINRSVPKTAIGTVLLDHRNPHPGMICLVCGIALVG